MSETSAAATYAIREDVPAHVPAALVYDYDVFQPGPPGTDIFEELFKLKGRAPPIFWTPFNGGHWYVTDAALAEQVLADNVHFSSQVLLLPREANPPPGQGFAPIHLDPPEHGLYRRIMQMALGRKFVVDALPGIRAFAIELIEWLKPRGRCDFIAEFGYELPTQVFLSLVNLPEKYATPLKARVHGLHDVTSDKAALFVEINEILVPFVRAAADRRARHDRGQFRLHRRLSRRPSRAARLDPRQPGQDERHRRRTAAPFPGDDRRHRPALCRRRPGRASADQGG